MSRVCDVTGRKPMFGNNVSHANNKTRRRFNLNLQKKRFWLADENRWVSLTVSTQGLRLIDKIGIRKVLNKIKADGIKVYTFSLIKKPTSTNRAFALLILLKRAKLTK